MDYVPSVSGHDEKSVERMSLSDLRKKSSV